MKTLHVTEGEVCLEACSLKDALWILEWMWRNVERLSEKSMNLNMMFEVHDSRNHWSLSLALVSVSWPTRYVFFVSPTSRQYVPLKNRIMVIVVQCWFGYYWGKKCFILNDMMVWNVYQNDTFEWLHSKPEAGKLSSLKLYQIIMPKCFAYECPYELLVVGTCERPTQSTDPQGHHLKIQSAPLKCPWHGELQKDCGNYVCGWAFST